MSAIPYTRLTTVSFVAAVLATAVVLPSAASPRPAAVEPTALSAVASAAQAATTKQTKASQARTNAEQSIRESMKRLENAEHVLDAARTQLTRLSGSVEEIAGQRLDRYDGLLNLATEATQVAADVAGVVAPVAEVLDPLAEAVDEDLPAYQPTPEPSSAEHDLRMARATAIRDHRAAAADVAAAQEEVDDAAAALTAAREAERSATAEAAAAKEKADAFGASLGIDKRLVRPGIGTVSSGFGMRIHPVTGARKAHTGVDFEYGDGRAYAAAEGTVVEVKVDPAFGNLITIAHGKGISTRYAHLAATVVEPGEHVSAGQVVGKIGSTGLSTGPHLHFEIQVNGRLRDPADWLGG